MRRATDSTDDGDRGGWTARGYIVAARVGVSPARRLDDEVTVVTKMSHWSLPRGVPAEKGAAGATPAGAARRALLV